jgi:hypothetical protein
MLRDERGGYNSLHQELSGEAVIPLQVALCTWVAAGQGASRLRGARTAVPALPRTVNGKLGADPAAGAGVAGSRCRPRRARRPETCHLVRAA